MKLSEIIGIKDPNADVGIEIEVEGRGLIPYTSKVWDSKHDGSLRDGIEYVYKKPLEIKYVEASLDELTEALSEAELSFSFRTSVHVHVNCLGMEYNQILNFIYLSTLLDSMLVNYCGDQRKTNRFCLRLSDAEGLIDGISPLFRYRERPSERINEMLQRNYVRYAAVNVESLAKFGTIEFRSMRGTLNKKILLPWVNTLISIREYSKGFSDPQEVYYHLNEAGIETVVKNILGEYYDLFDYPQLLSDISLNQSLSIELPFIPSVVGKEEEEGKRYKVGGFIGPARDLCAILPTTPIWEYLREIVEQGGLLDGLIYEYFDWERYKERLEDYVECPGVEELLSDLEEFEEE